MGKLSHRNNTSATGSRTGAQSSSRRRLMKGLCGSPVSSGGGSRKPRGRLAPPPPPQSMVLDEDSGFGGDQSLDSEPSSHSPSAHTPMAFSSTSTPQPVSLSLAGLSPAPQLVPSSLSLSSTPLSSPGSLSSSTSLSPLSMSSPLSLPSLGASSGLTTLSSILPSLAMVPQAPVVEKPRATPKAKPLPGLVELGGEEAQELPTSSVSPLSSSVPPLVSFRDVSLLSSLHTFKGSNNGSNPLLCVENGGGKACGRGGKAGGRPGVPPNPPPLSAQLSARSSDGALELRLERQPEEQHRARYQTEGSRGAVKDRTGAGHPTVKLLGYNKRTTLQVFVGSDTGRCGPHMFYQVCRVTGKNSTPCRERRVEGTAVIETVLDPDSEMTMSCDCVGILKERNVDVEHRFKAAVSRGRKKSTKCRLVFRTFVTLASGAIETLQVVSQPIACTQPPGVPEICRKSLSHCGVEGGEELFILGKNFLKDAMVVFQHRIDTKTQPIWEEKVLPDKDTLQPIHLVVKVPKYCNQSITEEVTVDVMVCSGGRTSEPHSLTYRPAPPIAKRELPQMIDNWEDKPLPKGVSPYALQLNRHYTETGMLPSPLPDFQPPASPSQPQLGTTQVCSPVAPSSVKTSRVLLSATKKLASQGSRVAPLSPRPTQIQAQVQAQSQSQAQAQAQAQAHVQAQAQAQTQVQAQAQTQVQAQAQAQTHAQAQAPAQDHSPAVPQPTVPVEGSLGELKQEDVANGGVTLEGVVEMLKVVQKFPSGSVIHTLVLQLVERLIQNMKDNLPQQAKVQQPSCESSNVSSYPAQTPERILPALIPCQDKTQKFVGQAVSTQPQMPILPSSSGSTLSLPMATPVSLLPVTVLPALPTTVCASPKIARVAPVAPVAPTTVVSSPALTRAVRVCVAEEPPLKKPREETDSVAVPGDYQLLRAPQCSTVVPTTLLPQKLTTSTHDTLATPTTRQEELSAPHQVISTPLLPSHQVAPAPLTSTLHTVYQPLLHNLTSTAAPATAPHDAITQSPQQLHTQPHSNTSSLGLQHSQNSSLTAVQTSPQSAMVSHHTTQQTLTVQQQTAQQTVGGQTGSQGSLSVQQSVQQASEGTLGVGMAGSSSTQSSTSPAQVSDPLLSQAPLCPMLPPAPPSSSQESLPVPTCTVSSSALTRSDPLLSQSSPVMETRATLPIARSEAAGVRAQGGTDPLMTPAPTTTQVSMQSEVTSAISLSETELLNYFDPNCFDNV